MDCATFSDAVGALLLAVAWVWFSLVFLSLLGVYLLALQ